MESPPSASPAPAPPASKGRVFFTRLISTVVLWTVMGLAIYWQSQTIFVAVAVFFAVTGSMEYFALVVKDARHRDFSLMGLILCLIYWASVTWHVLTLHTEPPMWYDLAVILASLQGSFLLCYRHGLEGEVTLQRIFSTVFGIIYTVVCFGFIVRLMFFHGGPGAQRGEFLMLYMIMVTKFSDMGAYLLGSLIGKHKMIPHISPAKSWEGLFGAVLGSTLATVVLLSWIPAKLAPLTWTHGMILVPILVFVAVTGDLAESVLKRCLAIKDTGHKFPGIGGILDLTDSLLFTAPVFYFYLSAIAH